MIISKLKPGRVVLIDSKAFGKEVYGIVLYDYSNFAQMRVVIAEKNQNKLEYENSLGKSTKITCQNEGTFNGKKFKYFEISYDSFEAVVIEICEFTINIGDQNCYFDNEGFCFIVLLLNKIFRKRLNLMDF